MGEVKDVEDHGAVTASFTPRIRAHFSIIHALSAAFFARQAADTEMRYSGEYDEVIFNAHKAYVTGAILMSVSFLEATINELFADSVDNPWGPVKGLDVDARKLLAEMWSLRVPSSAKSGVLSMRGILEKYEIALVLLRKPGFDVARSPYQEVSILAQLRNAIVHYQPVWVMGSSPNQAEKIAEHRFEKSLRGRFPLNPLTSDNKPFFPDKCLGHGCAAWAVASAISFADEFFAKTGLTPPYEHVRTQLGIR